MTKNYLLLLLVSIYSLTSFAQTEPIAQASNLSFIGVKAYGMSISFSASTSAQKYLVLRSNSPISAVPVDGSEYVVGQHIGNTKVMANAANTFYTFREAVANTEYYFTVFAYNDNNGPNPDYLITNPLTGSVVTKGQEMGSYYNNYRIDTENSISDLTNLLKNHNPLLYTDYRDVVENTLQRDTAIEVLSKFENRKYIIGEYSNIIHLYEEDISFTDYNREHVMARSWMPSLPSSDNDLQNETSDYHNLFLVKASVNQTLRSNYPFDLVDDSGSVEEDCKNGKDENGSTAFQPQPGIRGNIARTLFYMSVTYNNSSTSWAFNDLASEGSTQNLGILLQWHNEDPVDNFEIARNEYIYSIQNNRNPFIDFPEWAACIDFKTLTLTGACPLDTAEVPNAISKLINSENVNVYPNPSKEKSFVKLNSDENILSLFLENMNGQKQEFGYSINGNIADLNFENLANGVYILKIETEARVYINKVMLMK